MCLDRLAENNKIKYTPLLLGIWDFKLSLVDLKQSPFNSIPNLSSSCYVASHKTKAAEICVTPSIWLCRACFYWIEINRKLEFSNHYFFSNLLLTPDDDLLDYELSKRPKILSTWFGRLSCDFHQFWINWWRPKCTKNTEDIMICEKWMLLLHSRFMIRILLSYCLARFEH